MSLHLSCKRFVSQRLRMWAIVLFFLMCANRLSETVFLLVFPFECFTSSAGSAGDYGNKVKYVCCVPPLDTFSSWWKP